MSSRYRGKSAVREVGKTFGFGEDVLGRLSKLNSHYETFKGEELDRRLKEEGFDPTDDYSPRQNLRTCTPAFSIFRVISASIRAAWSSRGNGSMASSRSNPRRWRTAPSFNGTRTTASAKDRQGRPARPRHDGRAPRFDHADQRASRRRARPLQDCRTTTQKFTKLCKRPTRSGCFRSRAVPRSPFCQNRSPRSFTTSSSRSPSFARGPIVGKMLTRTSNVGRVWKQVDYIDDSSKTDAGTHARRPACFRSSFLKIAMEIAGFTGTEVEELRKAMGFKRPDKRSKRSRRTCVPE